MFAFKIDFLEASTWFTCTVSSIVNDGNICNLKGVATFNSPSDTFSNMLSLLNQYILLLEKLV